MQIPYALLALLLAALNTIGPFSVDTYLPAFPSIQHSLGASELDVQQSLTAYMLPFSFMMLWHGAISDALGRRRVIIGGLVLFALASVVCASAQRIELLWLGRVLQGLSAGAGVIAGRAVVRDLLDGVAAQKLMSHVAMVFGIAPAVAPILGGAIAASFGWRAIFMLLIVLAVALIAMTWRWLPETLPVEKRQSLHPVSLFRGYRDILLDTRFLALSLAMGCYFAGFFIYVMSAPVFLIEHLGLNERQFGWLFVPMVGGMICGSAVSARLAGKHSELRTIRLAFTMSAIAAALNLALSFTLGDSVASRIPQIALYTFGMTIATPTLTLRALDMFPARRGMAASCQGFIQTLLMALVAGVIAPALWSSTRNLALGMTVGLLLSVGSCALALRPARLRT